MGLLSVHDVHGHESEGAESASIRWKLFLDFIGQRRANAVALAAARDVMKDTGMDSVLACYRYRSTGCWGGWQGERGLE